MRYAQLISLCAHAWSGTAVVESVRTKTGAMGAMHYSQKYREPPFTKARSAPDVHKLLGFLFFVVAAGCSKTVLMKLCQVLVCGLE